MSDLETNTYALTGGIEIPEGADMDNYKTVGNYYCSGDIGAQTMQNCPFTHAFTLKIISGTGVSYPNQIFREYNTGAVATRFYNQGLNSWSEFKYITPTSQS